MAYALSVYFGGSAITKNFPRHLHFALSANQRSCAKLSLKKAMNSAIDQHGRTETLSRVVTKFVKILRKKKPPIRPQSLTLASPF